MNAKRFLCLCTAIALVVGLLSACGAGNTNGDKTTGDADGKITIRFMHQWAEENRLPYWDDLADRYMAEHQNVIIESEVIPNEPYRDKLRVMLGGDDVPDLFFTWDGDYIPRFAEAGALLDLTPYLEADPDFRDSFNQGLLTTGQVNGAQYSLPIRTCVNFILYNTAVFKQYNIEVPKTWSEFEQVCETLKNAGITPLALGNMEGWPLIHYISYLNLQNVPYEVLHADYTLQTGEFTDPGYVKSLQMMLDLREKGYLMDGVNSTSFDAAGEMFNAGKTAMVMDQCASFKNYYYDVMEEGSWDVFPMPRVEGAAGNTDMLVGWIDQFAVSSQCKHPEAVIDFLKFFYQEDNQLKLTEDLGFVSTISSVVENSEIAFPQLSKAMEVVDSCSGFIATIDLELNASVASVYQSAVQELYSGKSPEEIMADVQSEAARVMAENN